MTPSAFEELPSKKRLAPVVVLEGGERFFKEEALRLLYADAPEADRIEVRIPKPGKSKAAAEAEIAQVLDELRSASLFAAQKLIVVREAEPFLAEAQEAVLAHLAAPARGRTLVLDLEKLDKRTKASKRLVAEGLHVECKALYAEVAAWKGGPPWDTDLARWVVGRFGRRGKKIRTEQAYELTQLTGADLFELEATVEKASLLVGERAEVSAADLEAIVARTRRDNVFTLAQHILEGRAAKALEMLAGAEKVGVSAGTSVVTDASGIATMLVSAVHRKLGELRRVKAHLDGGGSSTPAAITEATGVASFAAGQVVKQVRALGGRDLGPFYRALLRCDLGVKGALGPLAAVERLVIETAALLQAPAPRS